MTLGVEVTRFTVAINSAGLAPEFLTIKHEVLHQNRLKGGKGMDQN
jgi:hypothetical protein